MLVVDILILPERKRFTVNAVKFSTISEQEFDEIPVQKSTTQKSSPWDEVIEQLIDGKVIALPIDDEKELKGIRIGLARRSSKAFNIKLSFKYDVTKKVLAVKMASEKPQSPTDEKRKPGRPAKKA